MFINTLHKGDDDDDNNNDNNNNNNRLGNYFRDIVGLINPITLPYLSLTAWNTVLLQKFLVSEEIPAIYGIQRFIPCSHQPPPPTFPSTVPNKSILSLSTCFETKFSIVFISTLKSSHFLTRTLCTSLLPLACHMPGPFILLDLSSVIIFGVG